MCQENRTYVLNEFRQNGTFAVLLMKNHIHYTESVIDTGFSSAFHPNETNMKNKHQEQDNWLYSICGATYLARIWKRTLLSLNKYPTDPSVNNQTSAVRTEDSVSQQVTWTYTCAKEGTSSPSSLPALLAPGRSLLRCNPQEMAVLVQQLSAKDIKKIHRVEVGVGVQEEKEGDTEVW